jgi:hypothetical protein
MTEQEYLALPIRPKDFSDTNVGQYRINTTEQVADLKSQYGTNFIVYVLNVQLRTDECPCCGHQRTNKPVKYSLIEMVKFTEEEADG